MDRASAREALQAADAASMAARRRSRGGAAIYLGLGLAEMLILGLVGGPVLTGQDGSFAVLLILALLPLAAATVYSASRSTTPRHSRSLNAALLGLAAVLVAVTLTLGSAVFPDSYPWWTLGAVLSGLAIALCGVLELRRSRTPGGARR